MTRTVRIEEVAELNPRCAGNLDDDEPVSFVPMAAVSEDTATIVNVETRPFRSVKSGYSAFRTGDILVAKITPCFENGKIALAQIPHRWGFGSTEFHVIRPNVEVVEPKYLLYFLRQPRIREIGATRMTGSAGQQRLPASYLAQLSVPLPSLSEQRRIVSVLDAADELRTKRRETIRKLDDLVEATFSAMFGDLRPSTLQWPWVRFEDVVRDTKLGLVRNANEIGPNYPYPYVRMDAIARSGRLELAGVMRTSATPSELDEFRLQPGDLLFNTRNSRELVGKTAVFRSEGIYLFNNNLLRIRLNERAHPEYVAAVMRTPFVQSQLEQRKSGTTSVFAIYYKDLKSIRLPLPPYEMQEVFATKVLQIEKIRLALTRSLESLDELFLSLQQRAFRGELSRESLRVS